MGDEAGLPQQTIHHQLERYHCHAIMAYYGSEWLYKILQKDLIDWIWHNKKLRQKITGHDLQHLFEFTWQRGLSIDLRRFETAYYKATFYPPDEKKQMTDEFVRKVC